MQTDELKLLEKLIDVIEQNVIPLTERGVAEGNKVFGAALLRKSDLSLFLRKLTMKLKTHSGTVKCTP